jgi:hypothetical protein
LLHQHLLELIASTLIAAGLNNGAETAHNQIFKYYQLHFSFPNHQVLYLSGCTVLARESKSILSHSM